MSAASGSDAGYESSPAGELADMVSPRLNRARALWRSGRHAQALCQFDEAVRLEPTNVRALLDAAGAYAARYRLDRAHWLLERLAQLDPDNPGVHHLAGLLYARLKVPARARACFERASRLKGVLPRTWIELASLYERAHRLEEADQLIDRALHAEPGLPAALLVRGRLQRRTGQPDRARATLQSAVAAAPARSELACEAWGELAQLADQQQDPDEAMRAIAHAKQGQMARESAPWKASEHVLGRFLRMVDTITAADFRRWAQASPVCEPRRVALLTGFPRSGTTLLEQVLAAHPDVASSEERDYLAKECFPSLQAATGARGSVQQVLNSVTPLQLRVQRQRYFQAMQWLLGEPIGSRLHVDKNPAYNLFIPIMLRVFPETRLVIALRDPRDVVISCYLRYLPLNPVSVRFLTLERTVQRYLLDMRAWRKFRDIIGVPWCEVRYEDAVADLPGQARRMLSTLGLGWDKQVMDYRDQARVRPINSPTYAQVAQPVYTTAIGRWQNYAKYLAPYLGQLECTLHG